MTLDQLIAQKFNVSSVQSMKNEPQIIIKAASRADAAKIWEQRKRLLEIKSICQLTQVIVLAKDKRYASGFINPKNSPTRISKIIYTN